LKSGQSVDVGENHDATIAREISLTNYHSPDWMGAGSFNEGYMIGHVIGDGTFKNGYPCFYAWEHKTTGRNSPIVQLIERAVEEYTGISLRFYLKSETENGY
jgi:hypothetical protein